MDKGRNIKFEPHTGNGLITIDLRGGSLEKPSAADLHDYVQGSDGDEYVSLSLEKEKTALAIYFELQIYCNQILSFPGLYEAKKCI